MKAFTVDEAERHRRLQICEACPELKDSPVGKRCSQCGCIMKFKSTLKNGTCPLKKW